MLSSVALLQQRFRDLERMKEMREGRSSSCVGISSAGIHNNPNNATLWPGTPVIVFSSTSSDHSKPRWFFHPDLLCPSRPLFETKFICLIPTESSKSTSIGLQPPPATSSTPEEETDVDTSLHL